MDESVSTLPGIQTSDDDERIICHVDMDCFYAACERLRDPSLEGVPVIVGMGYEPGDDGGVVATASYEAREYGIESAQPISEALDNLPRASVMPDDFSGSVGFYRPVDLEFYRSISDRVIDVLSSKASAIRVASLDEAYLDVTDATEWEHATAFASELKTEVLDEVGVTASVGIAPTRGVAKIASDHDKPDGLTVIEPSRVRSFLEELPLEDLHGVGPVTASTLREMGCDTIGDVAELPPPALAERFGDRGRELAARARGEGSDIVEPQGDPKSLSRESSLGEERDDFVAVRSRVADLAEAVAARAEDKGAQYRTVGIKVVKPPFDIHTRERTFGGPFADASLVESTALELLDEFTDEAIRKVGVRVSNLDFAADQAPLETWSGDEDASKDTDVSMEFEHQGRLTDFEQ